MLEVIEEMILCGVMRYNDEWCDIYCDPNGVLAFENSTDGAWCITELNMEQPLSLDTTKDLIRNIEDGEYGECIGVIYGCTGSIIVLITDNQAEQRYIWDLKTPASETYYYSTDEEYEGIE